MAKDNSFGYKDGKLSMKMDRESVVELTSAYSSRNTRVLRNNELQMISLGGLFKAGSQFFEMSSDGLQIGELYSLCIAENPKECYVDPRVFNFVNNELTKRNKGISFLDCMKMNIVDYTNVTSEKQKSLESEFASFIKDEGVWAALPPFEAGFYMDDSQRHYFDWLITDIDQDMSYFDMNVRVYAKNPVMNKDVSESHAWFCWQWIDVRVHLLSKEEHTVLNYFHPDVIKTVASHYKQYLKNGIKILPILSQPNNIDQFDHYGMKNQSEAAFDASPYRVGGKVITNDNFFPSLKEKVLKGKFVDEQGILNKKDIANYLDYLETTCFNDWDSFVNVHVACFSLINSFVHLNYVMQNRSESRSYGRKVISDVADTIGSSVENNRREWSFGDINVTSKDKPKRITKENIHRMYKTLSWNRRSHIRHYKSGKTVVVKSSVCHRDVDKQPEVTPQTIYRGR